MANRISLFLAIIGWVVAGCVPNIKTITPTGKKPLESVHLEGSDKTGGLRGKDHAAVFVDGGPVGTPLSSYPKPEVFIPVQRADGKTTDAKVRISARNAAGGGNVFTYSAKDVPVNAPPVSIDAISPPSTLEFKNEFSVSINGTGIFPAARNAGLDHPHAGPPDVQAIPVVGGPSVSATKVVILTDKSIQANFADTLPHGHYKIYVKNDDRYGGLSGTSKVSFEWK